MNEDDPDMNRQIKFIIKQMNTGEFLWLKVYFFN